MKPTIVPSFKTIDRSSYKDSYVKDPYWQIAKNPSKIDQCVTKDFLFLPGKIMTNV